MAPLPINDQVRARMEHFALTLLDSIIPTCAVTFGWFLARYLYGDKNVIGLLSATSFTSILYAAIWHDPRTSSILLFGVLISNLIFHGRYCQLRVAGINNTW